MPSKKKCKKKLVTALVGEDNHLDNLAEEHVLEAIVLDNIVEPEDHDEAKGDPIGSVFDLDFVDDPLIGTPAEVQKELDALALVVQEDSSDQEAFLKIVTYMHKYILGLVFKKYAFVRGYSEDDMYQEALIALFKKAIPSFKMGLGMSFLNFAKMCMNRHLITILHASRNRRKDIPMNTAISLDHTPLGSESDDDGSCPLSNVITDEDHQVLPFDSICRSESFSVTYGAISSKLSPFEKVVFDEYLEEQSYREAARNIRKKHGIRCNEKSIDNALLRIRKKATQVRHDDHGEKSLDNSLPLLE